MGVRGGKQNLLHKMRMAEIRKKMRDEAQAVFVPWDKRIDAPFAGDAGNGPTLLVFGDLGQCQRWIDRDIGSEADKGIGPVRLEPAGVEKMATDYAPQIPWFGWAPEGAFDNATAQELGFEVLETLPMWKLKMWAQYVQGDMGYVKTLEKQGV